MNTEEELKKEKLQLEIDELRSKLSRQQKIISLLPLLTIIIAIGGLWWNFYQFSQSQKNESLLRAISDEKEFNAQKEQNEKEKQARLDEFQKPFLQKRLELYEKAISYASTIANSKEGTKERNEAEKNFLQLYFGALHLVADEQFSVAKVDFANCLRRNKDAIYALCQSEPDRTDSLKIYSLELAKVAKNSINDSWKLNK